MALLLHNAFITLAHLHDEVLVLKLVLFLPVVPETLRERLRMPFKAYLTRAYEFLEEMAVDEDGYKHKDVHDGVDKEREEFVRRVVTGGVCVLVQAKQNREIRHVFLKKRDHSKQKRAREFE